jgi:uncharacterized protein YjhX (UPF0386 family)
MSPATLRVAERFFAFIRTPDGFSKTMDISRAEQRILHLLAQGGRIDIEKDDNRKITTVACITRDGWRASGLDMDLFRKLKRRRCIASSGGRPYRITQRGLELVRAQQDNQ